MCYNMFGCGTSSREEISMKQLSIRETRQALSALEDILTDEGEVAITRRGKAIARILPFSPSAPIPSHKDLREKTACQPQGSAELVRADRDER
jgi:antitoxin (DNA-binding transcriptional repressor) of toxin-antitoxin stability system